MSHLDETGLTYFAHLGRALRIGARMIGAGFACLIHAIIPGLFVDSASRTVKDLHRDMSHPPAAAAVARLEAEA
jgi:hypothetical protein